MNSLAKVPEKVHLLTMKPRLAKNNDRVKYYTSVINQKQSVISFATDYPVRECAYFISMYRNKYGHYPTLNNDKKTINIKNSLNLKKKIEDLKDDIVILEESSDEIIKKCVLMNLGLVLIHDFNFNLGNNNSTLTNIDINFSAQEIDLGSNYLVNYSIEYLNNLLEY